MQSSEVTCDTLHLDECTLQALLQASCLCLLFLLKESVQERSRKDEPDETSWLSNLLIFFWTSFKWISLLKFLGYPVLSFLPRTTLLVYLLGAASLERPPERPLPRLSNPCTYTYREWDATRSQKICSFKHFFDYFLFFSSFDHIWKIKVLGGCTVFGLLILSSILDCLLFCSSIFFLIGGLSAWMANFFLCPTTSWNIEIHCVSWYFMYILMYRYYLGTQLLQRLYIYTYT